MDDQLRDRVLEILSRKEKMFSERFANEPIEMILHELDVYQAELNAQNHELQQQKERIIKEKSRRINSAKMT